MVERYYDPSVLDFINSEKDKSKLVKSLVVPEKTIETNEDPIYDELQNSQVHSTGVLYEENNQSLMHDVRKADEEAKYLMDQHCQNCTSKDNGYKKA